MSEISELERRITSALDRIRRGVDLLDGVPLAANAAARGPDMADIRGLETRLDEERMVNAQLEERVRVLKERQDNKLAALETAVEDGRARLSGMDRDMQVLRGANAELRDLTAQMRTALSVGVAEPELINRALMAELEALRATRAAELAEVNAVLRELKPIIEEAQ